MRLVYRNQYGDVRRQPPAFSVHGVVYDPAERMAFSERTARQVADSKGLTDCWTPEVTVNPTRTLRGAAALEYIKLCNSKIHSL